MSTENNIIYTSCLSARAMIRNDGAGDRPIWLVKMRNADGNIVHQCWHRRQYSDLVAVGSKVHELHPGWCVRVVPVLEESLRRQIPTSEIRWKQRVPASWYEQV